MTDTKEQTMELYHRDGTPCTTPTRDLNEQHGSASTTPPAEPCWKCNGEGRIWCYGHVLSGICFRCNGTGKERTKTVKVYTAARLAKLNAAKAKRDEKKAAAEAKKQAAEQARINAFLAAMKPLFDRALALTKPNSFLSDLMTQASQKGRLTDRQVEAFEQALDRDEKRQAVDAAIPAMKEGRHEVTGKILSTKEVANAYGITEKMLVELADGNRIFGSVPKAIWSEYATHELIGATVTFTAKIERSRKDEHFGFFSRPTQASLLTDEAGTAIFDGEDELNTSLVC
jgi:hypothetical protein